MFKINREPLTQAWRIAMQRRLGLWLSDLDDLFSTARDRGVPLQLAKGARRHQVDRLGDTLSNVGDHNRRHHLVNSVWYAAKRAVAIHAVYLGDKREGRAAQFAHFNADHVPDIIELGAAVTGKHRLSETRVTTPHRGDVRRGVGSRHHGGSVADVGHVFAFGNTLEHQVVKVFGCRARGRPSDPPLDHATGRGCVHARRGQYTDALVNKKNAVVLLLHDVYGGIAPPTLKHLYQLARGTRVRDGTVYTSWAAPSYLPHYGQRLSSAAVFADAAIIRDGIHALCADSAMAA